MIDYVKLSHAALVELCIAKDKEIAALKSPAPPAPAPSVSPVFPTEHKK